MVHPAYDGGGDAPHFAGSGFQAITVIKKGLGEEKTRSLLNVLNFLAAPIGSREHLHRKFGVEGKDFTFQGGFPVLTQQGNTNFLDLQYIVDSPTILGPGPAAGVDLFPLHYSYAFVAQLLATLITGGRAIITGPPFAPASYARAVQQHRATVSSLTPALVEPVLRVGGRLPEGLRVLTVGGDALASGSVAELLKRNPGLELYLTYGLTEAGPRVSTLAAHREPAHRRSSVGLPLPGVRTRLRKTDPADEVGELVVETDTGMLGRVGVADAAMVPTRESRTEISTGDLFRVDADGYLYFHERRPTYIISRGEKVCLESVSRAAETIPGVASAQPWVHQNSSGDIVFALDVYRDGTVPVDELTIRRSLAKHLLHGELPARVLIHPTSRPGWRKSADT